VEEEFDVLADVLETMRFRSSIFFHSELSAPWGMRISSCGFPTIHIIFAGQCFVGSGEENLKRINAGEIVMISKTSENWIADKPGRELVESSEAGRACQMGQPKFQHGVTTHRIMCGQVLYDKDTAHPILSALPEILHFDGLSAGDPIWATIDLIEAEIRRINRHTGPTVDRLTEILFIQLLDNSVRKGKLTGGFLGALRDRRIYQALALIHANPGHHWTLNELGEKVGMSRSTLVRHFQFSVGIAPMTYVGNWKLAIAYNQTKYTMVPLSQIAENLGFASVSTMNKAFRRNYDCTPAALRGIHSKEKN
jgi:AraC-like DNA-binding protein